MMYCRLSLTCRSHWGDTMGPMMDDPLGLVPASRGLFTVGVDTGVVAFVNSLRHETTYGCSGLLLMLLLLVVVVLVVVLVVLVVLVICSVIVSGLLYCLLRSRHGEGCICCCLGRCSSIDWF